jgi:2'-5' RNA ligase
MNTPWRLFFALQPGPQARARLHRLAVELAACQASRIVPAANLHLTLLFIGQVGPERIEALARAARRATASAAPMTLAIARIGWFRQAGVVWAGPAMAPNGLVALRDALAAECRTAGLPHDSRPLLPHLTLLRKARCAPDPARESLAPPIPMRVGRLTLMRSLGDDGGVRYLPLAAWPLAGPRAHD